MKRFTELNIYEILPFVCVLLLLACNFERSSCSAVYPGIFFVRENETGSDYDITVMSHNKTQLTVLLSDCIRDIDLEYLFVTSDNRTITDYTLSWTSSNTSILDPKQDISTSIVSVTTLEDAYSYNISLSLSFERLVGKTDLHLKYTAKNNTNNVTTASLNITVAGISFTNSSSDLICGPLKPLMLNGSVLTSKNQVVLLSTIQYASSSQAATTSLDNIQLTIFSATDSYVQYSSSCTAASVKLNGNGSFTLPSSCGMGFTSDGAHFVMEIQKVKNGSFGVDIQWPNFDVGDSSEFDSTIYVDIVYQPTPTPFSVTGHTLAEKESKMAGGSIAAVVVGTTVAAFVASLIISKLVTGTSILSSTRSSGSTSATGVATGQSTYVERDIYGRGSVTE
eukprot:jgi/Galph1/3904/GphlegSOOS_G2521.1